MKNLNKHLRSRLYKFHKDAINRIPDSLKIQCAVYECLNPAETYFACGIVKKRPKMAFTVKESRLNKISLKGDVAVPVCDEHKKVLSNYIQNLSK